MNLLVSASQSGARIRVLKGVHETVFDRGAVTPNREMKKMARPNSRRGEPDRADFDSALTL